MAKTELTQERTNEIWKTFTQNGISDNQMMSLEEKGKTQGLVQAVKVSLQMESDKKATQELERIHKSHQETQQRLLKDPHLNSTQQHNLLGHLLEAQALFSGVKPGNPNFFEYTGGAVTLLSSTHFFLPSSLLAETIQQISLFCQNLYAHTRGVVANHFLGDLGVPLRTKPENPEIYYDLGTKTYKTEEVTTWLINTSPTHQDEETSD